MQLQLQVFRMLVFFAAFFLMITSPIVNTVSIVNAQITTEITVEPITVSNASQLTPLGMIGRGYVTELAYSPDGEILAVGSSVGLWLYDASNLLAAPRWLPTHEVVTHLVFSLDGTHIAALARDIEIWLVADGSAVATLPQSRRELAPLNMRFAAEGTQIEVIQPNGVVQVWDIASQEIQDEHQIALNPEYDLAIFSSLGTVAATLDDYTGIVTIWNTLTWEPMSTVTFSGYFSTMSFNPNGTVFVMAGTDLTFYDTATGAIIAQPIVFEAQDVQFSPDGLWMVPVGIGAEVRAWRWVDVEAGDSTQSRAFGGHDQPWVTQIAFRAENDQFVTAGGARHDGGYIRWGEYGDGTLRLWSLTDQAQIALVSEHYSEIGGIRFLPNSPYILGVQQRTAIRQWDITTGELVYRIPSDLFASIANDSLAVSNNGRLLAYQDRNLVHVWNIAEQREESTITLYIPVYPNGAIAPYSLTFSPDATLLATADRRTMALWDVASGTQLVEVPSHTDQVRMILFNQESTLIASVGIDSVIRLFGVTTSSSAN